MKLDWIEFDISVVVQSPLSIGTGALLDGGRDDEGGIAAVQLDADGRPCIPATSLKGALRATTLNRSLRDEMFGDISESDDSGHSGLLILQAALWDDDAADARNETKSARRRSVDKTFDRPSTAIDRDSGSVSRGKLFTQRAVKRGAAFRLKGRLLSDYGAAGWMQVAGADIERLSDVLSPLFAGMVLGRGARLGYGKVRADASRSSFRLHRCDPKSGYGNPVDLTARAIAALADAQRAEDVADAFMLTLKGTSPFIIVDPTASRDQDGREVITAVMTNDGRPVLWPSSLLGALRSRAAWIAEIDRLRRRTAKQPPRFVPDDRMADHPVDDRFLEQILGDGRRAVLAKGDLRRLSSVERLFGVPGWRGQIAILDIQCKDAGASRKVTNVAIDRLTGGAKDGALFTTEGFEGTAFQARIGLVSHGRKIAAVMQEQDRLFLSELRADMVREGLMLGHAASRGFGWFDAKIEERDL